MRTSPKWEHTQLIARTHMLIFTCLDFIRAALAYTDRKTCHHSDIRVISPDKNDRSRHDSGNVRLRIVRRDRIRLTFGIGEALKLGA